MTYAANPFTQLKSLNEGYPQEPFLDRPRRPNGYRDKPEYKEWQQGVWDQNRRILFWYQENLRLCSPETNALRLELGGRPVPGFAFHKLPDGTVRIDVEFSRRMYPELNPVELPKGWTRPLEIPGPGAETSSFLHNNRSRNNADKVWNLQNCIEAAAPPSALDPFYPYLPGQKLPAVRDYIEEVLECFVDQVRRLLDPEPFRLLNRLYGGAPTSYWTLLEYNLAVHSGAVLVAAAAANPGAVAYWLDDFHSHITPPAQHYPPNTPPEAKAPPPEPPRLPDHPGAVIGRVKAQFDQQGGQGWKAFARQPAGHIHRQLHRDRTSKSGLPYTERTNGDIALWLNARLHEANLNGRRPPAPAIAANKPARPEPQPAANPLPDPNGGPRQQLCRLADGRNPTTAAAMPKDNQTPPAASADRRLRPPEPPLFLKLLLPELRFARNSPGRDRNQRRAMLGMPAQGPMSDIADVDRGMAMAALDHLATLSLRHYAGQPELKAKSQEYRELKAHLQDLSDYCWAEPAAARQSRTFAGMGKASHRWHHEHVLREIAAELAAEKELNATPWAAPCPLPAYHEDYWQARFLACPADLQAESVIMRHCVGVRRYQRDSDYGECRIYHLQPRPKQAKPDWRPDEVQSRDRGSTVELVNAAPPGAAARWQPDQHRGCHNRPPTAAEAAFADRLAAALNAAESRADLAAAQ